MSRLEKIKNEKILKKKYKSVCRKIFMLTMILLTVSSIFLIDYRINKFNSIFSNIEYFDVIIMLIYNSIRKMDKEV